MVRPLPLVLLVALYPSEPGVSTRKYVQFNIELNIIRSSSLVHVMVAHFGGQLVIVPVGGLLGPNILLLQLQWREERSFQ